MRSLEMPARLLHFANQWSTLDNRQENRQNIDTLAPGGEIGIIGLNKLPLRAENEEPLCNHCTRTVLAIYRKLVGGSLPCMFTATHGAMERTLRRTRDRIPTGTSLTIGAPRETSIHTQGRKGRELRHQIATVAAWVRSDLRSAIRSPPIRQQSDVPYSPTNRQLLCPRINSRMRNLQNPNLPRLKNCLRKIHVVRLAFAG